MATYHLTEKSGSKKYTIATCELESPSCLANADDVFQYHGFSTRSPFTVEWDTVTNQKMHKGYAPGVRHLKNIDIDKVFAWKDAKHGQHMAELRKELALAKCACRYDKNGVFYPCDDCNSAEWQDESSGIPAMVDTGDGAPQYTFAPTGQLSLL